MGEVHTGACLCSAVKFRVDGPMREIVFCHCGQCRRQTGLYYASTNVADTDLTIEGAENITWYQSSKEGRRGFCKHCGSALFWKYDGQEQISIQAGSLDKPTQLTPGYHIFCADKGDFYEINDGLSQHAKGTPALVTNTD
jgi:hypothetical protein